MVMWHSNAYVGLYQTLIHEHNTKFKIKERRRTVASMLAQSMTEKEIAERLNVDQSTVSRDIKALREMAQRFVFDLAKSDLAYYYKQCLDGIKEAKRKAWEIFNMSNNFALRDRLLTLRVIKECDEAIFALFKEGPALGREG